MTYRLMKLETVEELIERCDGLDDYNAIADAIRADRAAVRAEARAEMLALLQRQCRNGVTASVSEEWLRCNEAALISGTLAAREDDD